MKVVGLDLSLTSTGVSDDDGARCLKVPLVPHASDLQRVDRLRKLSVLIDRCTRKADLVVIEGHSYNSQTSHAHSLGELHGVVKVCLLQRGVPFVLIPPAQMKKYATGRGSASKQEVLVAAVHHGADVDNFDSADAWWLRHLAIAYYKVQASNQVRKEVIAQIAWPLLKDEHAMDVQAQEERSAVG